MNTQNFNDAPTVQGPTVNPPAANTSAMSAFDHINEMVSKHLATAIVKKQKMQYSILHFGDFNDQWMICEVDNPSQTPGDTLMIVVEKSTPITLYPSGVVASPFTVQ